MSGSTLSDRLVRARSAVEGLSARELSSLAGLSNAVVTRLENESRPRPAAQTLGALARVLGTTVEYLVTGDGDPPSDAAVRAAVESARAERDRRPVPIGATHTANDFTVDRDPAYDQSAGG